MPRIRLLLILLFSFSARIAAADFVQCTPDAQAGTKCEVQIEELRPTQPEVGKREIGFKTEKYGDLREKNPSEFQALKVKKIVPIIIGPDGRYYLIDHHHSTLAFWEVDEKNAYVVVKENWSKSWRGLPLKKRMMKFWAKMEKSGHAWLERENGVRVDPMSPEWPQNLAECGNNRLRSLVWDLIHQGYIDKKEIHYFEFLIAKYLQSQGIKVEKGEYDKAFHAAVEIVQSDSGRRATRNINCLEDVLKPFSR